MAWSYKTGPSPRTFAQRIREGAKHLRPFIERRHSGRRKPARRITSDLGSVVNVSLGGVRMRTNHRLRGIQDLELWGKSARVTLRAEVVWNRKLGFRRHEAGLRFVGLAPEDARRISLLVIENDG